MTENRKYGEPAFWSAPRILKSALYPPSGGVAGVARLLVGGAEQQRDAPQARQAHQGVDDAGENGHLAAAEPDAYFHIISRDTGFDPLIAHLKTKKIFACRSKDIGDMPIVKAANSKTPTEKLAVVVANLKQRGASKPRTVKTLSSTISSLFQKALAEDELATLLKALEKQGYVTVSGTKVAYSLPE